MSAGRSVVATSHVPLHDVSTGSAGESVMKGAGLTTIICESTAVMPVTESCALNVIQNVPAESKRMSEGGTGSYQYLVHAALLLKSYSY